MDEGSAQTTRMKHPERSQAAKTVAFDSVTLLEAFRAAGAWLDAHIEEVNALNVFPVPDGDTGTNMSLTMRAALQEVNQKTYDSASEAAKVAAHGALMGARGNSGVILSQILRGFARSLDAKKVVGARDFAEALREGAATAYKGVMRPVEGTILTVIREAAEAAERAVSADAGLEEVLEYTVAEAKASLARTPSLLPVLAEAGVVDAGGQGLVYILEGMWRFLRGEAVEAATRQGARVQMAHAPEGQYNYDTQFIIKGQGMDVEAIRRAIAEMGDSVLVVGDSETIKVHVHSDHPGQVLEYGLSQGQITDVVIENMQLQYEAFLAAQKQTAPSRPTASVPLAEIGIAAVASGDGLRTVLESLGVQAIIPGGQTMNPSTQDILEAIRAVPSKQVIVLPNNGNILLAAEQAKTLADRPVAIVPTRTIPQGIAALLAFNYQADLETNVAAMTEAAAQVQTIEVTRAVRSAQVNGLAIQEGQFIGLLNDDLKTVGEDCVEVILSLLERIQAEEYEIVTIYYGQDVTEDEAHRVADALRERYDGLEIEVLRGGQPHYYYIISVE